MLRNGGRAAKQAENYTHLWRSQGGDIPCTPTGEPDPTPVNGQSFTHVRTPDGNENFVPSNELIRRSAKKASPPPRLSAADLARLDTWTLTIAGEARGTPSSDNFGNWRFGSKGALCVFANGQFHDFSGGAREHGRNALELIEHLHPNENTIVWARAWLDKHPGNGAFVSGDNETTDDFAEVEATAYIENLYSRAAPIDDTPGHTYITATRGLPLLPEDQATLRWIAGYRGDEGALVAPVTDDGDKLVKLLVTYVTPEGRKSSYGSGRSAIRGAKQPGLCRLGSPGAAAVETEGLEKGLAARAAGADYVVVTGGASNLGKTPLLPIVQSVVIARDADPAGSPADQALWRGTTLRLGQGLKVAVTARPNDIAPKDAPPLHDLDDVYLYDPELVTVLLKGANLEHGRLGDAVDSAVLDTVSGLDPVALGRARKGVAQLLGTTLGALDGDINPRGQAWAQQADPDADDGLPGKPLKFDEIEPHPDPVEGAALLAELSDTIRSYVVMTKAQCDACAAWAVFAHTHDLRDYAPLLIAKSVIKRSGKSRLAEVFERLVPRPLYIAGLTAAFIERAIEDHRCTLLIDEADRIRNDPALADRIDAQLNRSFKRRGAKVGKNVPLPGGGYAPRLFSTWAPTFIAGIGNQADTAEDRAVVIVLKRKLTSEKTKPLRDADGGDLIILGRKIARWVADWEDELRQRAPTPLEVDNDRAKDVWDPLLAIADTAAGDWPTRVRAAGKALVAMVEEEDLKIVLLGDIRTIFRRTFPPGDPRHDETPQDAKAQEHGRYGPRVTSKGLVDELLQLEDQPYGALGKAQKPLTQNTLARMLKDFGVRPGNIRLKNGHTPKGYYLRAFEDAFSRYLPSDPLAKPPQRHNAQKPGVSEDLQPPQPEEAWRIENPAEVSNSAGCGGVAVEQGPPQGEWRGCRP